MECCNPPDRATENRQDEIPDAATTCADLITDTGFKCNSMIPGADYGNEWGMDAEGDPYIITGYCNKLCGISDSTPPPDEPYPPNPPNPYPVDTRVWYEEERRRDQHTWDPTITCRRPSATSPTGFESSGQDDCRIKWRWQLSTQTQADCDAVIGQRGGGCVYTDASADAVGDSQGH